MQRQTVQLLAMIMALKGRGEWGEERGKECRRWVTKLNNGKSWLVGHSVIYFYVSTSRDGARCSCCVKREEHDTTDVVNDNSSQSVGLRGLGLASVRGHNLTS